MSSARRRLAAGALATLATGVIASGCPSRDLVVQITRDGVDTLAVACESLRDACSSETSCRHNGLLCDQATCTLRGVCQLDPPGPKWAPELVMGMAILLVRVDGTQVTLEGQSPCVPLNVRPCMSKHCKNAPADFDACLLDAFSSAVQSAMGNGLGFDGFSNPDDVLLGAAFFRKPGDEESCNPSVLVGPDVCKAPNLVAAAGFAAPPGSTTYDVTCASCEGGTHNAMGRDNGACPVTADACFLRRVAALLGR